MKTAIQEIHEAMNGHWSEDFLHWLSDNFTRLFELERQQITEAWIAGNKEGWAMTTDWPEDAQRYYEQKFNQQKAKQ